MPLLDSVFEWLLTATLRASVLAVVILCLQLLLRRWLPAGWRHALWLPMLLVLVLPAFPSSPFGLWPTPALPSVPLPQVRNGEVPAIQAAPLVQTLFHSTGSRFNPFALAWLAGTCVMLGMGIVGYRRNLVRLREHSSPPGDLLVLALHRAAEESGLKSVPRVLLSAAVDSPALTGFLRPKLLLPADFPAGLSSPEARLILLHEFTHLKRHDLLLNGFACTLQAIHWFNPILWFAFARMRADRETACDAQVLALDSADLRSEYGGALLKLQQSSPSLGPSLGFVGIFERAAEIKSRIREIARFRPPHPAWRVGGATLLILLLLFGATSARNRSGDPGGSPAVAVASLKPMTARQAMIEEKLDRIIIPVLDFEDCPLDEAFDFLRLRAAELDTAATSAERGINLVIRKPRLADATTDPFSLLTFKLKNVSLRRALMECAVGAGAEMTVDDFAVVFTPVGPARAESE